MRAVTSGSGIGARRSSGRTPTISRRFLTSLVSTFRSCRPERRLELPGRRVCPTPIFPARTTSSRSRTSSAAASRRLGRPRSLRTRRGPRSRRTRRPRRSRPSPRRCPLKPWGHGVTVPCRASSTRSAARPITPAFAGRAPRRTGGASRSKRRSPLTSPRRRRLPRSLQSSRPAWKPRARRNPGNTAPIHFFWKNSAAPPHTPAFAPQTVLPMVAASRRPTRSSSFPGLLPLRALHSSLHTLSSA
mmetsp:Transcript_3819/g.11866  ORF Transcript_3819/g.11866 Transcript_3819/m.11866 type:complete len:245 (+) Transcript_3819:668-1402(+)